MFLPKNVFNKERLVLCISTSEQVLHMRFASRNQIFDAKTTFYVLLSHTMYNLSQELTSFWVSNSVNE